MKRKQRKTTKVADTPIGMTLPHAKVLGVLGERMDKVDDCLDGMLDDLGRVNALLQAANAHGDTDVVGWCADVAERMSREAIESFNKLDTELIGLFQALQANRERLCPASEGGAQ